MGFNHVANGPEDEEEEEEEEDGVEEQWVEAPYLHPIEVQCSAVTQRLSLLISDIIPEGCSFKDLILRSLFKALTPLKTSFIEQPKYF